MIARRRPVFRFTQTGAAIALSACALTASSAWPTVAAAQDLAAGEKVFQQCRVCHQVGETARNAVGPKLNGIVGRVAGSVEGYNYSAANKASGVTWTEANLAEYLADPKAFMPGNKMPFAGVKKPEDIAPLIAFLRQYGADGKKP